MYIIANNDRINNTNDPWVALISAGVVPGVKTDSQSSVTNVAIAEKERKETSIKRLITNSYNLLNDYVINSCSNPLNQSTIH